MFLTSVAIHLFLLCICGYKSWNAPQLNMVGPWLVWGWTKLAVFPLAGEFEKKIGRPGEGDGFENSDTPGQGEGEYGL